VNENENRNGNRLQSENRSGWNAVDLGLKQAIFRFLGFFDGKKTLKLENSTFRFIGLKNLKPHNCYNRPTVIAFQSECHSLHRVCCSLHSAIQQCNNKKAVW